MLDHDRLAELRNLFPVTRRYVFLNHAGVAPVSTRVVVAMSQYLTSVLEAGGLHEPQWMRRVEEGRQRAARLINASPEEIAFLKNTTEGVLMVANGIRWREGDNVVVPSCEFPANVYPWCNLGARHGVEVRFVPPRGVRVVPDDLWDLCRGDPSGGPDRPSQTPVGHDGRRLRSRRRSGSLPVWLRPLSHR